MPIRHPNGSSVAALPSPHDGLPATLAVNKAKKALGAAGLSYTEGALEQFELANKPGALAQLAGRLAKKGINIDCALRHRSQGVEEGGGGAGDFQGGRDRREDYRHRSWRRTSTASWTTTDAPE